MPKTMKTVRMTPQPAKKAAKTAGKAKVSVKAAAKPKAATMPKAATKPKAAVSKKPAAKSTSKATKAAKPAKKATAGASKKKQPVAVGVGSQGAKQVDDHVMNMLKANPYCTIFNPTAGVYLIWHDQCEKCGWSAIEQGKARSQGDCDDALAAHKKTCGKSAAPASKATATKKKAPATKASKPAAAKKTSK